MEKPTFKQLKGWITVLGILGCLCGFGAAASPLELKASKLKAETGDVLWIEVSGVKGQKIEKPQGSFLGREFPFFPLEPADSGHFAAMVGVPYDQKAGTVKFEVQAQVGGQSVKAELVFRLRVGKYPTTQLHVDPKMVHPSPEDQARIERDIKEVGALYKQLTEEKLWGKGFTLPVASSITGRYGTRRVFNGVFQSFHNGTDLKAPEGTEVHAPAAAKVVLAKDLFFTGNTVILDHGYGLFTIYAHMSRLDVQVGKKVQSGDVLGLSGSTGRATGPHLHWGVVLHQSKVNPEALLKVAH